MTHSWRSHPHRSPHGTSPPPPVRRYNWGEYVAVLWPGQIKNAVGKDSGTFTDPDGNTGHYNLCRIPGGHLGTAVYPGPGALVRNTDGPCSTGVKGLLIPYYWSELEPSKDNYVYSSLDADMNACITLGVQAVIMIILRTFSIAINPAPGNAAGGTDAARYLNQLPYNVQYSPSGGGWQMSRWDFGQHGTTFSVQDRLDRLYQRVCDRWDSCPNFEGIATQETAAGESNTEAASTNYDADDYLTGLKMEADSVKRHTTYGRHFGFANYIPGNPLENQATQDARVDAYYQYLATTGCSVAGGPDALPDNAALQNRVYPHYSNVYANPDPNNGPTFLAAQDATFSQGTRTIQEIRDWLTGGTLASPALPGGYVQRVFTDYRFWNWELGNLPWNFNPDARDVISGNAPYHHYGPP